MSSVKIVRKDINGQSEGMGFINMDLYSGNSAINGLNDVRFMNFYIKVRKCQCKPDPDL
jgi:hypothetical protein